jgi:hypothetical protein
MTTVDHPLMTAPLRMMMVDRLTMVAQTAPARPRTATVTATASENAAQLPSGVFVSKASTVAADSAFLSARPTRIVPTVWCAKKISESVGLTAAATPMVDPQTMMADLPMTTVDLRPMTTVDLPPTMADRPMMADLRMTADLRMIPSPSARKTPIAQVRSVTWLQESAWMKSAMTVDLHPMTADLHPMRAATMVPVTATTLDCSLTQDSVFLHAPSIRIALPASLARRPECAALKVTSVAAKKTSSPRVKPTQIVRQRALLAQLTASA